ncbi:MAG: hypothetical protein E7813_06945 [Bradyrhizobium sp.]|uniref:hypothetical protein n=1 Tax=Bradyrhizobium sp. TaxID=376 RepID=UPI0011F92517|nr:hypothetical protein [Bradyrhizobium sp.]THD70858.1 MAG: hypothetical protein E7813_06945 [Bradyrhizobium sp.]
MTVADRIRVQSVRVLSDNHYTLKTSTFEWRRANGEKVFEAFMSPGAVTEKLHFFVAEYAPDMKIGAGGGIASEGEDIEVLELPIVQALAMIGDGRIADAKTIMLLQYAALNIFARDA